MQYNFYAPTRVLFGAGRLNELHTLDMPGKKAAIIISKGTSCQKYGYLKRLQEQLEKANCTYCVFAKVGANPLKQVVEEGATFIKDNNCDFVVALGGGSVMDAAKNMAMLATQDSCDLWDFVGGVTGKNMPIKNSPLPWIAITTTAGTGSEVDNWGVITNLATNEKLGTAKDDRLFAKIAIVDASLMTSVPPLLTAFQGFDALFHCTEGYLSKKSNLMSQMFDLTAIQKIGEYLPRAVKDGNDITARQNVAFANTLGGYSMVAGSTISCHALEHAMSAFYPDLPHGAGLIMISQAYYEYWVQKGAVDELLVQMAQALGDNSATKPQDFVFALLDLQKKCGVENLKMSDYGIKKDDALLFAPNAFATTKRLFDCDRLQMTQQEAIQIYQKSYK